MEENHKGRQVLSHTAEEEKMVEVRRPLKERSCGYQIRNQLNGL